MMRFVAVAVGGAAGAVARYGIALLVALFWRREFPLATFIINVTGSFILGFFVALASGRAAIDPLWRLLVATGFIGAYTTFSTFEYETHRLTEGGMLGWAAFNVVSSVLAGYLAVYFGAMLARR